jgi:hypothetical protein
MFWTSETRLTLRKHTLVWLNNAIEKHGLDDETIRQIIIALNKEKTLKWNG